MVTSPKDETSIPSLKQKQGSLLQHAVRTTQHHQQQMNNDLSFNNGTSQALDA